MKRIVQFILIFLLLIGVSTATVAAKADRTIKGAQQVLQKLGYNPGPLDGVWGKNTAAAVRKYQQDRGIVVTGKLDKQTLIALGLKSAPKTDIRQLLTKKPVVTLRSTPQSLDKTDIVTMIREKGFHHPDDYVAVDLSPKITGQFMHEYESKALHGDKIVIDHVTGLIWQQHPTAFVPGKEVQQSIKGVNAIRYAGLSDWRLPTIEELASLLASPSQKIDFIDPVFDMPYWFCLSADTVEGETTPSVWAVFFEEGYVMFRPSDDDFDILLVYSEPQ